MIRSMGLFSLAFVLATLGGVCHAGVMFDINYEQDGDYASGTSFGTIEVSETVVDNQLKFYIELNTAELGPNPDIHQFGFTSAYDGPLTIDSVNPDPGFTVANPVADGNIQGILTGQKSINYVIDFGSGGFKLSTVEFLLTATSGTFGISDLLTAEKVSTNGNKTDVHFALHVQNTSSPAVATSEALAGIWRTIPTPGPGPSPSPTVPEPTTLAIWSALGVCGFAVRRRRTKK